MTNWREPTRVTVPPDLEAAVGGHPLVSALLVRRGINTVEQAQAFMDPALYVPSPASALPGMEEAVGRLRSAIRSGQRICVWGDFDVDGQTATALLVQCLQNLGANVRFHIPVRESEGHGVNLPVLKQLTAAGIQVLVTCDTGVTAHEAVDYAAQQNIDVIITDHHDLPSQLPNALAVVNPKQLPRRHPLFTLPGVGVAYKLAEALYDGTGRQTEVEFYLDLVALGIVADVALQTGDTRYLLQRGLETLRRTTRLGLQILMQMAEVNQPWLTEEHIGFVLGPRLNALGRLADANLGVEFLTTSDPARARMLATQLEGLNSRRKLLTDQVFQGALTQIERDPELARYPALVLAHPSWPAGVIGIVASRLVEHFNRPVVLLSNPPGQWARGSARSVEGCNITAAIAAHQDLVGSFGGHPMAAGLSIDPDHIPAFRRALAGTVAGMLGDQPAEPTIQVDGYLPLQDITQDLVEDLERLAPFGPGNPAPVLVSQNLTLQSQTPVGRDHEHLLMTVQDQDSTAKRVIWWQGAGWPVPEGQFDLAYVVRSSTYRGQREVQVEWVDARPTAEPEPALQRKPPIQVVDYRSTAQPQRKLQELRQDSSVQVWCEADTQSGIAGQDRNHLLPGPELAIWTTPPGSSELAEVLQRVSPRTAYLFGIDPSLDQADVFLQRLAGLVKYTLRALEGHTSLSILAAATAQRQATVWLGLRWLAARGHVTVLSNGDEIQLSGGGEADRSTEATVSAQLQALLAETRAYRSYFARADAALLLGDGEVADVISMPTSPRSYK